MHRREFLVTGTAGIAACIGPAAVAWPHGNDIPYDAAIRLLARTRRAAGLAMPEFRPDLAKTARRQALHMASLGVVSHYGPDEKDPAARARQAGFSGRLLGETLAETYDGPGETMASWLSHASTRDVLMSPDARSFGVAAIKGTDGRIWWSFVTGT